jgi:hypothetical protein
MYGLQYYCFSLYVLHPSVIFSFITVAMHTLYCLVIKEKWKFLSRCLAQILHGIIVMPYTLRLDPGVILLMI